jgi:hypothetical protein
METKRCHEMPKLPKDSWRQGGARRIYNYLNLLDYLVLQGGLKIRALISGGIISRTAYF